MYLIGAVGALGHIYPKHKFGRIAVTMDNWTRYFNYVAFVYIHLVRFSHSGLVCSGAYIDHDGSDQANYMIKCGKWFMTYIVVAWCVVPAFLLPLVFWKGRQVGKFVLEESK